MAEGRLVVDRGGVVDVDAVLLAVLPAVTEAEELLPERLAADGVGAGQAVPDDHVEVPLVLLVDGLQVALLVCDLGVEDLDHGSQPLDLVVLREHRGDVGVLNALDFLEVALELGLLLPLERLDLHLPLLDLCPELHENPLVLNSELVVVILDDLCFRIVLLVPLQGLPVSHLPEP